MAKQFYEKPKTTAYDLGKNKGDYALQLLTASAKKPVPVEKKLKTGPNVSDVYLAPSLVDLMVKGREMQMKAEPKNPYGVQRNLGYHVLSMYSNYGVDGKREAMKFDPLYKMMEMREKPTLKYENGRLYHPGNNTVN